MLQSLTRRKMKRFLENHPCVNTSPGEYTFRNGWQAFPVFSDSFPDNSDTFPQTSEGFPVFSDTFPQTSEGFPVFSDTFPQTKYLFPKLYRASRK
jgi:hypothetical protein